MKKLLVAPLILASALASADNNQVFCSFNGQPVALDGKVEFKVDPKRIRLPKGADPSVPEVWRCTKNVIKPAPNAVFVTGVWVRDIKSTQRSINSK